MRLYRREEPELNPREYDLLEPPDFDLETLVVVVVTAHPPLQSLLGHSLTPCPEHFLHASTPVQLHVLQAFPYAFSTSFSLLS